VRRRLAVSPIISSRHLNLCDVLRRFAGVAPPREADLGDRKRKLVQELRVARSLALADDWAESAATRSVCSFRPRYEPKNIAPYTIGQVGTFLGQSLGVAKGYYVSVADLHGRWQRSA